MLRAEKQWRIFTRESNHDENTLLQVVPMEVSLAFRDEVAIWNYAESVFLNHLLLMPPIGFYVDLIQQIASL